MSKVFMNKRKTTTAVIAVVITALLVFGGTFAWQSISQTALNEVASVVNPGGRLHDDFNDITEETNAKTMTFNKDVYAENFTTLAENGVQIFARIRLDEYMEFGEKAGVEGNTTAKSLVYGAELDNKNTWTTHIPNNAEDPFHEYWNWTLGGQTTYMPTFDKNKDSLRADINGTFDADFTDYIDYTLDANSTKTDNAVYDNDDNSDDEILTGPYTVEQAVQNGFVYTEEETHTVKETLNAGVITMEEWLQRPADKKTGNFWVWDNDGWAYWAGPINPDTATGLLLDGISRTEVIINDDWYYGINVVAQFITKDDMGKANNSGFYDTTAGVAPSSNALRLLHTIGVEVNETVTDATALAAALDIGGIITVKDTVNGETQTKPWGDDYAEYTAEYVMSEGGTLTGDTLVMDQADLFGLVIEAGADSDRASFVNDITIEGNSESLLYIGENGNKVTLNNVTVNADGGAGIYAEWAQGGVVINDCIVKQNGLAAHSDSHFETAVAAAQGANIVINGGTYESTGWAVYCFGSAPSTVTINGGTFIGKLQANNADKIIIKGGSFSVDPTAYLADGYTATLENGMYIVK